MIDFHMHGVPLDYIGFIPEFLSEDDHRSAAAQFDDNYAHGGGWHPMKNAKWQLDLGTHLLTYPDPEDPEYYYPLASATLRDEKIFVYECAWVCIVQPDGSFEVSRMD